MTRKVTMKNLKTLKRVSAIECEDGAVVDKNGKPLGRVWVPVPQQSGLLSFFVCILVFGLFAYWGARLL